MAHLGAGDLEVLLYPWSDKYALQCDTRINWWFICCMVLIIAFFDDSSGVRVNVWLIDFVSVGERRWQRQERRGIHDWKEWKGEQRENGRRGTRLWTVRESRSSSSRTGLLLWLCAAVYVTKIVREVSTGETRCLNKMLMSYFSRINKTRDFTLATSVWEKKENRYKSSDFQTASTMPPKMESLLSLLNRQIHT